MLLYCVALQLLCLLGLCLSEAHTKLCFVCLQFHAVQGQTRDMQALKSAKIEHFVNNSQNTICTML